MHLEHFALIVEDYDEAITFFVDVLGFELVEDSAAVTTHARAPEALGRGPPAGGADRPPARPGRR